MAAGFSIKKENLELFDNFIQNDYQKKNKKFKQLFTYDFEISQLTVNLDLYNEINKIGPFGNENLLPLFLIKNVNVTKFHIIDKNHVGVIIKTGVGKSLNSICFNCLNNNIGNYLLSYKKKINIIAEVTKNTWNNKNNIQLNIKDIILPLNTT